MLATGIGQYGVGFQRFCIDPSGNTEPESCRHRTIAQMIPAGTATPGVTYKVYDTATANALFGAGSVAATAVFIHLCQCPDEPLYVTPLNDGAGAVKATFTTTITGPATESGTLSFYVWPRNYTVNVTDGDTATTIATAIAAVLNADPEYRYVAVAAAGVVTHTAKNGGTVGNNLVIVVNPLFGQVTPAGVTVTTAAVTPGSGVFAAGAISAVLDECCYDCYSTPFYDPVALEELATYLDDETGTWSCSNITCFGHNFNAQPFSSVGVAVAYGDALNDPARTVVPVIDGFPIPPWVFSVAWAARNCCSICRDPGRPIVRDNGFLSCLNYGSACKGVFTRAEKTSLDDSGLAIWDVSNVIGTNDTTLWIENNTTTYKRDAIGRPDKTWKQVETRYLISVFIKELASFYNTNYSSVALVNNGVAIPEGRKAVSANIVNAGLKSFIRSFSGILVDQDDALDDVVRVQRNTDGQPNCYGDPNRLDVIIKLDTVNQLLRIATNVNVRLQSNCQNNRSVAFV